MGKWDEHDPLYDDMSFPENKKSKKLKKYQGKLKFKKKQRKKRLKSQRSKGYHKGAKINERVFRYFKKNS